MAMALPTIAPAAKPPRTPAPTQQPKQPASAVFGDTNAAMLKEPALTSPKTNPRMFSSPKTGRVRSSLIRCDGGAPNTPLSI